MRWALKQRLATCILSLGFVAQFEIHPKSRPMQRRCRNQFSILYAVSRKYCWPLLARGLAPQACNFSRCKSSEKGEGCHTYLFTLRHPEPNIARGGSLRQSCGSVQCTTMNAPKFRAQYVHWVEHTRIPYTLCGPFLKMHVKWWTVEVVEHSMSWRMGEAGADKSRNVSFPDRTALKQTTHKSPFQGNWSSHRVLATLRLIYRYFLHRPPASPSWDGSAPTSMVKSESSSIRVFVIFGCLACELSSGFACTWYCLQGRVLFCGRNDDKWEGAILGEKDLGL